MDDSDGTPTTGELKARHAAAIRWGHKDEAARIYSELRVRALQNNLRRKLAGTPLLTADQADRVCAVLAEYTEGTSLVEAVEATSEQVERHKDRLRGMVARGDRIDPVEVASGN